jgi:hypothetical protein
VNGNGNSVTQAESDWLDIQGFQDIAFYVEIGNNTVASTNLDIQTSPTKDEVFFGASISGNAYLQRFTLGAGTTGVQGVAVVRWSTATNQIPARYVRWRLTSMPSSSAISFRIWLSLNQAGWSAGGSSAIAHAVASGGLARPMSVGRMNNPLG